MASPGVENVKAEFLEVAARLPTEALRWSRAACAALKRLERRAAAGFSA